MKCYYREPLPSTYSVNLFTVNLSTVNLSTVNLATVNLSTVNHSTVNLPTVNPSKMRIHREPNLQNHHEFYREQNRSKGLLVDPRPK